MLTCAEEILGTVLQPLLTQPSHVEVLVPVGHGPVILSWQPAAVIPLSGQDSKSRAAVKAAHAATAATNPEHCIQFVLRLLGENLLGRDADLVQVRSGFLFQTSRE